MALDTVTYAFSHIPAEHIKPGMRIRVDDSTGDSAEVLSIRWRSDDIEIQFTEHSVKNATVSPTRVLELVGEKYHVELGLKDNPALLDLAETVEFLNAQGGVTHHVTEDGQHVHYAPQGHPGMTSMHPIITDVLARLADDAVDFGLVIHAIEHETKEDMDDDTVAPDGFDGMILPQREFPSYSVAMKSMSRCERKSPTDKSSISPLEDYNTVKRISAEVRANLGKTTITETVDILKRDGNRWYATVAMTTKDNNQFSNGVSAVMMLGKRMQKIGAALEEKGSELSRNPLER